MRYSMSVPLILATVGTCTTVLAQASPHVAPTISVNIAAVHRTLEVGSSVLIMVALKNVSDRDLPMISDSKGFDYHVQVRDEKGNLVSATKLGEIWNSHSSFVDSANVSPSDLESSAVYGTLKVGETSTRRLDVGKLYQMDAPGKYTIQVQRQDPGNPSTMVKSNTITITIRP